MSFSRKFLKDTGIYGVGIILTRGIGLLMLPFYVRVFSANQLGVIEILAVAASFAALVVPLEISQAVGRFFLDTKESESRIAYASTALWFTILTYSIFLFLALGASGPISEFLLDSRERQPVLITAISAISLIGIFQLVQNQLRYELMSFQFALVNTVFAVVTAGVTILAFTILKQGLRSVYLGQITAASITLAMAWWYSRASFRLSWDGAKLREMLRFSLPLIPSGMAVFFYLFVDRLAISRLMTFEDLGVYGVALRLSSIVSLAFMGVSTSLTPLIYRHYREDETPREIAAIFSQVITIAAFCLIFLSLFSRELITIFATQSYLTSAPLIPILAAAALIYQLYVFAPGLAIAKKTSTIALISVATAILNTVGNLALIPLFGLVGAASASLASAILLFSMYVRYSQRHYRINYEPRRLVLTLLLIAAAYSVAQAIEGALPAAPFRVVFIKLTCLVPVCFAIIKLYPIGKYLRSRLFR